MKHLVIFAAATLLLASCATASPQSQLATSVERDLRRIDLSVDVDRLSSGQIASLHLILNGRRSRNDKRGLAKSVIGGDNSLRSILLRNR